MGHEYSAASRTVTLAIELEDSQPTPMLEPCTLVITGVDKFFNQREVSWIRRMTEERAYADGQEYSSYRHETLYAFDHWRDGLRTFAGVASPSGQPRDLELVLEGEEARVPTFGSPPQSWTTLSAYLSSTPAPTYMAVAGYSPWLIIVSSLGSLLAVQIVTGVAEGSREAMSAITQHYLRRLFRMPIDRDEDEG